MAFGVKVAGTVFSFVSRLFQSKKMEPEKNLDSLTFSIWMHCHSIWNSA